MPGRRRVWLLVKRVAAEPAATALVVTGPTAAALFIAKPATAALWLRPLLISAEIEKLG
jgi:hypothetical protein